MGKSQKVDLLFVLNCHISRISLDDLESHPVTIEFDGLTFTLSWNTEENAFQLKVNEASFESLRWIDMETLGK